MLAEPRSSFSQNYVVTGLATDDGAGVAPVELRFGALRETGEFAVDGVAYRVRRDGPRGPFLLTDEGGQPVARARKPSAFRNAVEVEHPGGLLTIAPTSWTAKTYAVRAPDGQQVGTVRRPSAFRRRVEADLPGSLPPVVRLFALWMVLLLFRRSDSAAAGG